MRNIVRNNLFGFGMYIHKNSQKCISALFGPNCVCVGGGGMKVG